MKYIEGLSKKRIITALFPLIVFNLVVAADFFVSEEVWSASQKSDKNEKVYTSEKTQEVKSGDKVLYRYEGSDGDCYKLNNDKKQQDACLNDHPYGGQGTMTVGGNLVVENAQAIYLNGYDSAGYNWIMSTSSEPYGNTMATRNEKGSNVYYGNHILADGTIKTGGVNFKAAGISVLFNQRSNYMVDEGIFEQVGRLVFVSERFGGGGADVFSVLEKGICGVCGESCAMGKVGKDYQFIAKNGLDVKETTKINGQIRICGDVKTCEEACCREAQYLSDDTWDNFVGANCEDTPCIFEPKDPFGLGPSFCYPQPYPDQAEQTSAPITEDYHEENGFWVRGGTGR